MTTDETAKIDAREETLRAEIRVLKRHFDELSDTLKRQQDILNGYGMTLPSSTKETWRTMEHGVEALADETNCAAPGTAAFARPGRNHRNDQFDP